MVSELDLYSVLYFLDSASKPSEADQVRQFEEHMLKQILQVKAIKQPIAEGDNFFIKALSSDICVIL